MFDSVRNNKKIVQGFLALITLPFALWGVDSYVRNAGAGADVAKVGDSKITLPQFQLALREQSEKMRQQLGAAFKPEMLDTPEARMAIINGLVDQRLLALEAHNSRLGVSDAAIIDIISSMPGLQEDGKFSRARYEAAVRAQGMSPEQFEAQLRQDLTIQQLVGAVGDTSLVASAAAERLLRLQAEQRDVAELRLAPQQFAAEVKLDADAAKKFYDANQKMFETPEQVKAEYVVLSLDGLLAQTSVSDADVKAWYDAHVDQYRQAEERRASHILITADKGAPEADKAKAKAKADEILKEVQKNPGRFAELAKQYSQDPGSGANGGDLGFFGRNAMVKPFADAAFGLKDGEISGVVQSDFGYHIIKLTGIRPAKQKTLDEVRPEIEGELKRQAAQRKYAESAEAFSNMVYEQSDSLKPVADKFKLTPKQTPFLVRNMPPQAFVALGPVGNEKLIAALFGDDAIKNKRNTEAVEVAPNTLVAARVVDYKAASLRPFESVRADIETMLKAREAAALAVKKGGERLAELQAGQDKLAWSAAKPVSRLDARQAQLPPQALAAIFRAGVDKLPAYAGVELPNGGGYALYKISAVRTPDQIDAAKRGALKRDYTNLVAREDFAAYLAGLRQRYKIDINKALVESKDRQ